jgi:hypothetical protein
MFLKTQEKKAIIKSLDYWFDLKNFNENTLLKEKYEKKNSLV